MKVLKFSTPTCGQCRLVEQKMKAAGIEHENIDCTSAEGVKLSEEYGINHVPVLVILDDDGKEMARHNKLPDILTYIESVF